MSIKLILQVFDVPPGKITSTEKLILLTLANYADDVGRCFPSVGILARQTGLSRQTIRTTIASLKAKDFLSIEARRHAGTKYRKSNVYTLKMKEIGKQVDHIGKQVDHIGKQFGEHRQTVVQEPVMDPVMDPVKDKHEAQSSLLPEEVDTRSEIEKQVEAFIKKWNSTAPEIGLPVLQTSNGSKKYVEVRKILRRNFRDNKLFKQSADQIFDELPECSWLLEVWKPDLLKILSNNKQHVPVWELILDGTSYRSTNATPQRQVPEALRIKPGHFAGRGSDA